MFSGIVVEVGTVEAVEPGRLRIRARRALERTTTGGSVAVNGVCLTAASIEDGVFDADVMPETLRRTSLGGLGPGSQVNLEPALGFGQEVGGHLVQGHVDATGEVVATREEGNARWVSIRLPADLVVYCVPRGSVAIDGTSLTIAAVDGDVVSVSLVPHTLESTIASGYTAGSKVNVEADILARYVSSFLSARSSGEPAPSPGATP